MDLFVVKENFGKTSKSLKILLCNWLWGATYNRETSPICCNFHEDLLGLALVLKTFKLCRCLFSFLDQFFKQTCFSLFLFIASVFSTWNSFTACFMLFRTRYFTEPSKHACGFFPMVFDGKPSHFSPGVSIASYVSYLHY